MSLVCKIHKSVRWQINCQLSKILVKSSLLTKFETKIWKGIKVRGFLILPFSRYFLKLADVTTTRWRHQWKWNFVKRCQSIFGTHCQNFMKKFKDLQKLSKEIIYGGALDPNPPRCSRILMISGERNSQKWYKGLQQIGIYFLTFKSCTGLV